MLELGSWGSTAPLPPDANEIGVDSTILGLRTLFDPAPAEDLEARVELRLGEQIFAARVLDGTFEVARGSLESADAVLATSPATLARLLWQGLDLATAARSGKAEVEGDRRLLDRFLRLFPLPA